MTLVFVCSLVLTCVAVQQPQVSAGAGPSVYLQTAVELRMRRDDAPVARIRVLNGKAARVTLQGGRSLALTPSVREGWVELLIEELEEGGGVVPRSFELGRYGLERGVPVRVSVVPVPFDVEWSGTFTPGESGVNRPDAPCSRCCVVCGGDMFCGCAVETPCGTCCCPTACSCLPSVGSSFGGCAAESMAVSPRLSDRR